MLPAYLNLLYYTCKIHHLFHFYLSSTWGASIPLLPLRRTARCALRMTQLSFTIMLRRQLDLHADYNKLSQLHIHHVCDSRVPSPLFLGFRYLHIVRHHVV